MKLNIKGKDIEVNEDKLIELIKREGLEVKSGEFEMGQEYWYISEYAEVSNSHWDDMDLDFNRLSLGDAFPTKELAEQALERRKSIVRLWAWQKSNAPFEPDWSDDCQWKYSSIYNYACKELGINSSIKLNMQTELPYFATSDDVERFNKACESDLKLIFNVK